MLHGITKIDIGTSATPDLYGTVSSGDLTAKNAGILSNSEIVGTLASDVDVTFTVTGTRTAGEVEIIIFYTKRGVKPRVMLGRWRTAFNPLLNYYYQLFFHNIS